MKKAMKMAVSMEFFTGFCCGFQWVSFWFSMVLKFLFGLKNGS